MARRSSKPPKFHHYVPKTYLKHWLDDNDLLYIYNKKNHTVKASSINGQYFGKNHLNTITYPDNTKGYWVEQRFADLEGTITPALNKIAATTHDFFKNITYEDRLFLSMFVSVQCWRLPMNQSVIEEMIQSGSFASIHSSIRNGKTGEKLPESEAQKIYERMAKDDFFKKAYPLLLGLSKYLKKDAYDDLRDWRFYFQEPGRFMTSDNPILYTHAPTADTVFKDFILPISPGVLLISSKHPPKEDNANLSSALNILQICHANQFVAGQDKGYLETISELYKANFADKPLEAVERYVFGELFA